MRRSVSSLATTLTVALALTSAASAFPEKLLQFVTPYPFGGSHSLHASLITAAAEPHFGQPMIPVFRTGGGGVVGADYVLKRPADGHVMLFGDPNLNSLRPQIEKLNKEINAALVDPNMKTRLTDLGAAVFAGSPADFGKFIVDETEKWGKVV